MPQQLETRVVWIVALQAAAPGTDPEQARRVDLEGPGGIEAQTVLDARILHQQMGHAQRMRVHECDAGAVATEPDLVVGHLRDRIDPGSRQRIGFGMVAADPADLAGPRLDHRCALFARADPQTPVARFGQGHDLASGQGVAAARQQRFGGEMPGPLAPDAVLGADPQHAIATEQQAAHPLGGLGRGSAGTQGHSDECARRRIVPHQSGIGGDVDTAVRRHGDRVDIARTDAVPTRGVMTDAREGFGGRIEHRHAVDFVAEPYAAVVVDRHRENEIAAERGRIVDAMFEAPEPVAIESQQALLRADPEIAVGALRQRRDHAIRNVVLVADGVEHAFAEIERTRTRFGDGRRLPGSETRQQHGDAPPFARPSLPHHACTPWVRPLP